MISRTLHRARGVASLAIGAVIASLSIAGFALPAAGAPEVATPSITVSPSTDVDPAVDNSFEIKGEGFIGDSARFGAYVLIGDQEIWTGDGPLVASGWLQQAWVQPNQIEDGAFSIELTIPAGSLEQGVKYTVATSAAHGLSASDRSLDSFAPIDLAEPEPVAPALTVSKSAGLVAGESVTVSGTGYQPGAGIYVLTAPDVPLDQVDFAFAMPYTKPSQRVTPSEDGTFSVELEVADRGEGGTAIYTLADHTAQANRALDAKHVITFVEPEEPGDGDESGEQSEPTVTVSKTTGLARDGETITVKGTGFVPAEATTGTRPPLAGKFTGAYVIVGQFADNWKPSEGAPSSARKPVFLQKWGVLAEDLATIGGEKAGAIAIGEDGSFETTFEIDLNAETFEGFNPENAANFGVYTYAGSGATYVPFETFTNLTFADGVEEPGDGDGTEEPGDGDGPEGPGDGTEEPQCEAGIVNQASLTWGIKESFRDYITGPVASGSVTTKGKNVTETAAGFTWSAGKGKFDAAASKGELAYTGSVQFVGHDGLLDVKLSDPTVVIKNSKTATIRATAHATNLDGGAFDGTVDIATLDLATAKRSSTQGVTTFSGAEATLTKDGEKAFGGFYAAGDKLDDASFALLEDCGDGKLPEQPNPEVNKPTITLGGDVAGGKVRVGDTITFKVSNAKPGAKAKASVHSTPVNLGTKRVSAGGTATFAWTVPADFETGNHTFRVVIGGQTYSKAFAVLANDDSNAGNGPATSPEAAEQCLANSVAGGTFSWGVKQAFVSYITGNIAKGSVNTSGAASNGGQFVWSGGSGAVNTDKVLGSVRFGGSVNFTGHGGILDLTLSSPRVALSGPNTATLILDVHGTNMDGDKLSFPGVRFATLNLAGGTNASSGSSISYRGVPATLTAAGAQAFAGFYDAGTALDPVTFTLPLGAQTPCTSTSGTLPSTGASTAPIGLSAMLLVVGLSAVVIARKRNAGIFSA